MTALRPILTDTFDIADRLREIDARYRLYYNLIKRRYEVHAVTGLNTSLQCVLPYPTLDCRSLHYVRSTRVERAEHLMAEIERDNAEKEMAQLTDIRHKAERELEHTLSRS